MLLPKLGIPRTIMNENRIASEKLSVYIAILVTILVRKSANAGRLSVAPLRTDLRIWL